MLKKKAFVSFDCEHDKILREFITSQSRHLSSPFEVLGYSVDETSTLTTLRIAKCIQQCDVVLVMVGPHTHKSANVLNEVKLAQEAGKQIIQILGYRLGQYPVVEGAGRLHSWNSDNIRNLMLQPVLV